MRIGDMEPGVPYEHRDGEMHAPVRAVWKTTRKPFFSIHKRPPKESGLVVKPLFWVEPHWQPQMKYVVFYVPGRLIVLGWTAMRFPLRYIRTTT